MSNIENMKTMNTNNRPEITDKKIEEIKKLISENPSLGRTNLSVMLCEMWNWRGLNGQVKDMSIFRYRNIDMYSDFLYIPIIMQKSWERKIIHYIPSFFVK